MADQQQQRDSGDDAEEVKPDDSQKPETPSKAKDSGNADDTTPRRPGGKARRNGGARGRGTGRVDDIENDEEMASPQVITVRPMARRASMRKRHWGLALGFLLIVALPLAIVGYYLTERANDQYASVAGFSVRQEDSPGTAEMLGGLAQFMGGSSSAEADMLYEFIRSQDIVAAIDARLDLRSHYSAPYATDPVFALDPESTIEELVEYWHRIVIVAYDQNTGLINLTVLAFDPEMAQTLAREVIAESQVLVNQLNATARADALRYAEEDLREAENRLKAAREALVRFRTRTQIVDPESDLRGRMGVLSSLQQQLAQAMIDYDLFANDASAEDPRVSQALRRIEVIRERISAERRTFAEEENEGSTDTYPELMAEYETLVVDREFAEEAYRVALATLDLARGNAARQSRYLSTYVQPTLPQMAEFPRRAIIFGLAGLFLVLFWTILSLMFYAVRDRK